MHFWFGGAHIQAEVLTRQNLTTAVGIPAMNPGIDRRLLSHGSRPVSIQPVFGVVTTGTGSVTRRPARGGFNTEERERERHVFPLRVVGLAVAPC